MRFYRIDGIALLSWEEARHRGALNAALNSLAAKDDARDESDEADWQEACRESMVGEAFEIADEVVREYRRRCGGGGQKP